MKLIVGLGNPGKQYEKTRHNIGFILLDEYAKENGLSFDNKTKSKNGLLSISGLGEDRIILLKPETFMNLSGEAVGEVASYYNIDPEDVLVVYDDKDIEVADIRFRQKGSSGGHNGIKSIINHLGTEEFNRLRIGIGSNPQINTADYVLGKFSDEDLKTILDKKDEIFNKIEEFINK
jgi:PTH1 family peptidyl-tRNA hydrolase